MDPWPANRCIDDFAPCYAVLTLLSDTLGDAGDERPLQTFLASHPHLLRVLLPPGRSAWCFDRPRLGAEFVPDFLLCTDNSTGYSWVIVELESPTRSPLTAAGLPSQKLNEALGQIRDWRAWLRLNIAYAQGELGFTDLDAECKAYVVVGRRHQIPATKIRRYRELSSQETTIMTYDRLVESIVRGRPASGAPNE